MAVSKQAPGSDTKIVGNAQEAEAHDRDVFRRMEAEARSAAGEPAPAQRAETKATASPRQSAPASPGEPEPKVSDADKRERAVIQSSVLRRDGLSEAAVERLRSSMDAEEFDQYVDKRRKVQADQDRVGNELRKAKEPPPKDAPQPSGKKPKEEAPKDGQDPRVQHLSPKQAKLYERMLSEGNTEDAAELLEAVEESTRGNDDGRVATEPRESKADKVGRYAAVAEQHRATLDQLAQRYPGLNNLEARIELVERADRLLLAHAIDLDPDPAKRAGQVFGVAARVLYDDAGTPDPTAAQRSLIRSNLEDRNGFPDATEARRSPPKARTNEEFERDAFRLLASGKTPEEVVRLTRNKPA